MPRCPFTIVAMLPFLCLSHHGAHITIPIPCPSHVFMTCDKYPVITQCLEYVNHRLYAPFTIQGTVYSNHICTLLHYVIITVTHKLHISMQKFQLLICYRNHVMSGKIHTGCKLKCNMWKEYVTVVLIKLNITDSFNFTACIPYHKIYMIHHIS